MPRIIYENNSVQITSERQDEFEAKINVNGQNLIWISRENETEFQEELSELLDRYRI